MGPGAAVSGKRNDVRKLLDLAEANPGEIQSRLDAIDAAQTRALEEQTKARAEQRRAQDMINEASEAKRQVESSQAGLAEQAERIRANLAKMQKGADDAVAARIAELEQQRVDLNHKRSVADALAAELQRKIDAHSAAVTAANAETTKYRNLNADLAAAIALADEREDAAAKALARVKALAAEA